VLTFRDTECESRDVECSGEAAVALRTTVTFAQWRHACVHCNSSEAGLAKLKVKAILTSKSLQKNVGLQPGLERAGTFEV